MRFGHWSGFGLSSLVARAGAVALATLAVACAGVDEGQSAASSGVGANAEAPEFLDAARFSDLVTIDPSFPFGVTRRHAADGPVLGARWGKHDGPSVTTKASSTPASPLKVTRWSVPAGATDAAASTDLTSVLAPNLPAQRFWGGDGFVDLPFGELSMLTYSSSGTNFAGEVLFYTASYDRVVGRASVNGYFSGVGISDGAKQRVVYSALSGLTSSPSGASENGLYASDACNGSPAPSGSCAASVKLFGWNGFSGPVATDADGNVFVAAFLNGAAHTDAIFALSKAQSFAAAATQQATLAETDTNGTSSLAAVSKPGSGSGWLLAKGHDSEKSAPVYARAYHTADGALAADGAVVERAITTTSPDASLSLFSDPRGGLWLAIEAPDGSALLELEPKP